MMDSFPSDWDWLNQQPVVSETELVRHVRPAQPVTVRVDGRTARGVVIADSKRARRTTVMSQDETQVATILRELQERAKELNCLYRVDELLNRPELPLELIFRGIVEILPHGWQYPHDCQARIIFENDIVRVGEFPADQLDAERQPRRAGSSGRRGRSLLPRADAALRRRPVPEGRAQADRDHRRAHLRPHHAATSEVGLRRPDWRRAMAVRPSATTGASCWSSCATPIRSCCN